MPALEPEPPQVAVNADRGDDQDEQRSNAVDGADPPLAAGQQDLHGADDHEQHAPADVGSRQPGDERRHEDRNLEVVDGPARVLVLVQRVRAVELPGRQVDLQEDADDDEAGGDEVEPVEDAPKGSHG